MNKAVGIAALLSLLGTAAVAAPGTDPNPTKGNDNGYHDPANLNAQCGTAASSGAFGAFSHGTIPTTYPVPRGADGQQTGLNNSGVCGNRHGNLPEAN